MRSSATAAFTIALIVSAFTLPAQTEKAPRRPKLPAGTDTNSARVYYDFALEQLANDPEKAADALYWSTRLEPMWADAYYARRIAMLMEDPRRLERYETGDRRTIESREIRAIDSLFLRALTINPFVSQTLERQLFNAFADDIAQRASGNDGSASEIRYVIDMQMARAPAATRAWLAYGEGDFDRALELYAQAIQQDSRNGPLHADRARLFFQMNHPDSALAELTVAVDDMRKRDKKDIIYVYQSKALFEQSVGVAELRLGHADKAREAFGRALQEDLSYYPAHLQLAFLAIESKDTTTALSEMELAVQIRADDASAKYLYGYMLLAAGRDKDAETQLRAAIDLNPVYAAPRFALARAADMSGRGSEAVGLYRTYLTFAAKDDARRPDVEARVAELSKTPSPQ